MSSIWRVGSMTQAKLWKVMDFVIEFFQANLTRRCNKGTLCLILKLDYIDGTI